MYQCAALNNSCNTSRPPRHLASSKRQDAYKFRVSFLSVLQYFHTMTHRALLADIPLKSIQDFRDFGSEINGCIRDAKNIRPFLRVFRQKVTIDSGLPTSKIGNDGG